MDCLAIKRYMAERYPQLTSSPISMWPLGARIVIGRGHALWSIEIRLAGIVKTDTAYFDTLYNRLTCAIDRKVKELGWTKPLKS